MQAPPTNPPPAPDQPDPLPPPGKRPGALKGTLIFVGVTAAVVAGAGWLADTMATDPAPATETAAPAANKDGALGAGVHLVSEIGAGTWRTDGPPSGDSCYWARLSDTTGDTDAILANDTVRGPGVLTIKESDQAVKLRGDCQWRPAE